MRGDPPNAHSRSLARFMHREAQVDKSFNVLGTVFENSRNVLAAPLLRVRRRPPCAPGQTVATETKLKSPAHT